jgi:hypothetical protein
MQLERHVAVTEPSHEKESVVDLPSIPVSRAAVALSPALLGVPALVAGHPAAGALLLGLSFVAAVVLLERRAHATPRAREVLRPGLVLVPAPSRPRPAHVPPQARWELVERDGRRSLSMRWS